MADFCRQCSIDMFGGDCGDLSGLLDKYGDDKTKWLASVICEGCGFVQVNHLGECVSEDCLEHGHPGYELISPFIPPEESSNDVQRETDSPP